jgi:Amt family ammonium transporter
MQCGFTMLESGMVRAKNVKNIILKVCIGSLQNSNNTQNIAGVSIGVTAFWILGYGFAFGDTDGLENGFIGTGKFMLFDFTTYDYWMFQWAFCATASTIARYEQNVFLKYKAN